MDVLRELWTDVERRVTWIRTEQPDWLCNKGCDACCRRLAGWHQITALEWQALRSALAAWSDARLAALLAQVRAMGPEPSGPVVCPLLDQESGACPVYVQRPVACRTYGFYVERDKGLYCQSILQKVEAGELPYVVWGNHEAVDRALTHCGESRSLWHWLTEWRPE